MENIFAEAQRLHLYNSLDVNFSYMLGSISQQEFLMLASASLSANVRSGHTCLPLSSLTSSMLFNGAAPFLAKKACLLTGNLSINDWQDKLLKSKVVSDGSIPTPLVLDNKRLYLQRMWRYECLVAKFFNKKNNLSKIDDYSRTSTILSYYFPDDDTLANKINWQKIAVAIALINSVSIISGGPGTGKTYIVSKLIAVLSQLTIDKKHFLHIVLAAPTGKAAIHLSESLSSAFHNLNLNTKKKQYISYESVTLHKLLGENPNNQRLYYRYKDLLNLDVLIIDEASMIDLSIMAKLITVLPSHAKLVLLGDHYQLSSVEPGSILGDICKYINTGYSLKCISELELLTGFKISQSAINIENNITDYLCLLRKNYRFSKGSDIAQLASIINIGDVRSVRMYLCSGKFNSINYRRLSNKIEYQNMVMDCINGYRKYLLQVKNKYDPISILESFNDFRLLCALREGPFGVDGLNYIIEKTLIKLGLFNSKYSIGRPIMITRNLPLLKLHNGDIGILLFVHDKQDLRVCFLAEGGGVKTFSLNCLSDYETSFAMTVHKSQGSEFNNVALVLPNKISPILTRELLYTAVTRARNKLFIYATYKVLQYSITNKTKRYSGLTDRLFLNHFGS